MEMRYQIIDTSGATVATAEIIDDAQHAAEKYDAKHIYDKQLDRYVRRFEYSSEDMANMEAQYANRGRNGE